MSRPTGTTRSTYRAPATFDQFMKELREPVQDNGGTRAIDPNRYAAALGMEIQALAARAGIHRSTLRRNPDSPTLQAYLGQALHVIGTAAALNGELFDTLFWSRNEPIPTFNYETAETLVSEGRADDLLRYLQSLSAGFSG